MEWDEIQAGILKKITVIISTQLNSTKICGVPLNASALWDKIWMRQHFIQLGYMLKRFLVICVSITKLLEKE